MPIKQPFKLCCDHCDESIQIDIDVLDISTSREGKIELPYYLIESLLEENNWYFLRDRSWYGGSYSTVIKCPKCKG
jgi:hypothetical protein